MKDVLNYVSSAKRMQKNMAFIKQKYESRESVSRC